MELEKVIINNFRSISKCTVMLGNVTSLVGENNAGKSSLLRALNSFFNYELEVEHFFKKHHQYSITSLPRIELFFSKIPIDSELIPYTVNDNLIVRFTFNPQTNRRILHYKKSSKYTLIGDIIIEKIKEKLNFILIPPIRDPAQIKWAESSLLKELIEAYLSHATINRDNFSSRFKDAAQYLENNALIKIATKIKGMYSLNHNFKYDLSYDKNISYKTFLHDINFRVNEKSNIIELTDCGTGIQSLTFIALYRLLVSYKHQNVILGLEEPETNLHPQAQKELITSINETVVSKPESKVIFTTHSPVLIDQLRHEQVILFRKIDDPKRGYKTSVTYISHNFFIKNNLDSFKYYQFHHYRNSEIFYAKFVIIVESKNDAQVIKLLSEKEKINLDLLGVSILNLDGIDNIKYPVFLLKELNIPFLLILDKDYFLPYSDKELSLSRDRSGFPKYKYEYKSECIIEYLIPKATDRSTLLKRLRENHSKALDLLENYNIICMKYSLDNDLVASNIGASLYYNHLNVPASSRNKEELLKNRYKQIKKIENLLYVVDNLPHKNLPNSYKRIKKILVKISKNIKNN